MSENDAPSVMLELPGFSPMQLLTYVLPPIGTKLEIHKHFTDGGTYIQVEVTGYDWEIAEPTEPGAPAPVGVLIRTVRTDKRHSDDDD